MRRHRRRPSSEFGSDSEADEAAGTMKCVSCRDEYEPRDAGTCRECYEEASETEEELKREIEDLKSKVSFLRFWTPFDHYHHRSTPCFSDIVLVASDDDSGKPASNPVPVSAHKAVLAFTANEFEGVPLSLTMSNWLASRSPVFRAMLENEMEESLSGTIKISDVSYDALRAFVNYLYTAEACLDEQMACDLLVLAEKYQVKHLKTYCEKFMVSKLNWESALVNYAFAHQHNAKNLLDAALSLIMDNMDKLSKREEYMELVEKDPRIVVEIYEAYLSKQVNTAAHKDSPSKS
ncbi:hypothetical protein TEA_020592 [Camellia sinensis var. sinensis]|uniref:BTB domain-containing protein n=1 Tax=Camellia sinensis var. sinensis TaxID=542762 RepID=A0A4S4EJW0_CAMSN|nr:hypothetical protein TEA_020592 [Camellia sinensis var. sinensis]